MIIYVAALTALLSLLVLTLVYLADRFEREPLDLIQNAFLAGLAAQLALILGVDQMFGIEAWSGPLYLLTLAALAAILPALLADEKEFDERFDGIVYAVAFTVGAASVVHLFNLPRAAARYPESVVLGGGEVPDVRDLLLLLSAPGPRVELSDLFTLVVVAMLAGAVLGVLKLADRPAIQQVAGMLAAGGLLAGLDLAVGGGWPVRVLLAVAAVATSILLKSRSVFRHRNQQPEREIFLGGVKTALMIFGAIVVALAVLMSLTDSWEPAAASERLPQISLVGDAR
ncbi:MAG: hypothetical protein AAF560_28115 [Acidobacteriota bacterium]